MIRRVLPFVPVAIGLAFALGVLLKDASSGWSAALGVSVVTVNFIAFGVSLAWAARISAIAVYAVGLGGFVLRLVVVLILLLALDGLAWFSPLAFVAAVVPATVALLVFEMRIMTGPRLQADLWYFREGTS